jgi:hypothetical protein
MCNGGALHRMARKASSTLKTFHGAVALMLRDGELTREEKRLVIKLAGLLDLKPDEPKKVYDAVLVGESVDGDRFLSRKEQLNVYARLFETAFLNASISEDEYIVVAYLRYTFDISAQEHDVVIEELTNVLEEHIDRNVIDKVRDRFGDAIDQVTDFFDTLRTIIPEGGRK